MGKTYSEGKEYKVIAFILAGFANDEQIRIIQKVTRACKENNCKVVFYATITDFFYDDLIDAGEKKIFDLICVDKYDAIILMSESFKQDEGQIELIKRANAADVPIFAIDKYMEGAINLAFDYGDCFEDIVKHMVEHHGYRIFSFMTGWNGNSYSDERLNVFKKVLSENGIEYDDRRTYEGYFWEDPTVAAMDKMFADELPIPEAIVCANDAMALTVIKYLRQKGYKVPEDVAVSGFDAIELEKYSNPRLTTGVYNVDEMVRILLEIISKGNFQDYYDEVIPIYNRMQIGQSCGCEGEVVAYNITDEMRKIKSEMHLLMKYQGEVNQMVANYGNVEALDKVAKVIPEYMNLLMYKDLWLCFEQNMLDFMDITGKINWMSHSEGFEKNVGVLHYVMDSPYGKLTDWHSLAYSELIPDLDGFFEKNDYCMVSVLHMKGIKVGYAVISFDADEFRFVCYEPFLTNLRHLLEIQHSQRQVMHIYERDSLTNLYNRNGFYKRIQRILDKEREDELTVIFIDMDGLKKVNDTYGHAEGDEALLNLGRIIYISTENEITARTGGDEFLIAFEGTDNAERAEEIARLINQGIDAYNQTSGKDYTLRASIGIFTDSVKGHTLDYFLKQADDMMYIEKSQHKKEMGDLR